MICTVCCCGMILLGIPSVAHATTLATTTYALDSNGPSSGVWQGSQHYSNSLLMNTLDADVEFAVFGPGNFQSFLDENGIDFPDANDTELINAFQNEFIYAYQIVDIATATTAVSNFTVGLQNDEFAGITGVTYIPHATDYGAYPLQPVRDPTSTGGGPGVDSSSAWGTAPVITRAKSATSCSTRPHKFQNSDFPR